MYPLDDSFEGNLRRCQVFFPRVFRFEGINLARECMEIDFRDAGTKRSRNRTIECNQAFRLRRLNAFVFTQGNRKLCACQTAVA